MDPQLQAMKWIVENIRACMLTMIVFGAFFSICAHLINENVKASTRVLEEILKKLNDK